MFYVVWDEESRWDEELSRLGRNKSKGVWWTLGEKAGETGEKHKHDPDTAMPQVPKLQTSLDGKICKVQIQSPSYQHTYTCEFKKIPPSQQNTAISCEQKEGNICEIDWTELLFERQQLDSPFVGAYGSFIWIWVELWSAFLNRTRAVHCVPRSWEWSRVLGEKLEGWCGG